MPIGFWTNFKAHEAEASSSSKENSNSIELDRGNADAIELVPNTTTITTTIAEENEESQQENGNADHEFSIDFNQVRRASSGSIRLRRSNSPMCRRRERRLTRISLCIVWMFLFCHIWKLVPTAYEVLYGDDHFPVWTHYIKHLSHALIVLNSSVNFLIYILL